LIVDVCGVALIVMFVAMAIMTIMIKLAQVDFITEKIFGDWTIWNWFALAVFINNIVGLFPNEDVAEIAVVFRFITPNVVGSNGMWNKALRDALFKQYGRVGLLLMCSLNAEDVSILLNTGRRFESSDKMFELVPQ